MKKQSPFASLHNRDFVLFLCTRFFLTLAIQMQSVIVGWQVYHHTRDVFALGLIGLAEAIPFILVSLFAGHVADHFNRKKIILIATSIFMVSTGILHVFSWPSITILNDHGVKPIFLVIMGMGVIRGFMSSAFPSFLAQLVPREHYVNSSTWNSTVWHVASVLGPVLAGFICVIGFASAYAVNVILIAISFCFFVFIPPRPISNKNSNISIFASLKVGLKFVFGHQLILAAMSLDLFAVLFGGAVAMLPAFADKVLHVGPVELGYLRAIPAVGAVCMAILIALRPPAKNAGILLLLSVFGFGLATIAFGLSTDFYWALFFLFLTGAFDNVSVVIRHTILQLSTPDDMRGRVSSINSVFIGSSNEIGGFESGLAARFMGLQPSIVFGGLMTLLVVGFTSKLAPKLRNMDLHKIH